MSHVDPRRSITDSRAGAGAGVGDGEGTDARGEGGLAGESDGLLSDDDDDGGGGGQSQTATGNPQEKEEGQESDGEVGGILAHLDMAASTKEAAVVGQYE